MTTAREAVLAALGACPIPVTLDQLASKLGMNEHAVQMELIQLSNAGLLVRGPRSGGPAKFGKVPRWTHRTTYLYATKDNVAAWKTEAQPRTMRFRQDDSARMPLGIFDGEQLLKTIPIGTNDQDQAQADRAAIADKQGRDVADYEILQVCHKHPTASAVDCLDCEPIEA